MDLVPMKPTESMMAKTYLDLPRKSEIASVIYTTILLIAKSGYDPY
jgi:hypothetical protein